jgi:hypothetical protein
MEFVSNYKPKKSCLKIRQSDNRPWHGDEEDVEAGNPDADLFEQASFVIIINTLTQE